MLRPFISCMNCGFHPLWQSVLAKNIDSDKGIVMQFRAVEEGRGKTCEHSKKIMIIWARTRGLHWSQSMLLSFFWWITTAKSCDPCPSKFIGMRWTTLKILYSLFCCFHLVSSSGFLSEMQQSFRTRAQKTAIFLTHMVSWKDRFCWVAKHSIHILNVFAWFLLRRLQSTTTQSHLLGELLCLACRWLWFLSCSMLRSSIAWRKWPPFRASWFFFGQQHCQWTARYDVGIIEKTDSFSFCCKMIIDCWFAIWLNGPSRYGRFDACWQPGCWADHQGTHQVSVSQAS